jgi:hypothetical protein
VNLEVRIERVVFDGIAVEPGDRARVRAAIEAELARRLAADGVAAGLMAAGAVPSVPGGAVEPGNGRDPQRLGRQVARAVHAAIGGPPGGAGGRA